MYRGHLQGSTLKSIICLNARPEPISRLMVTVYLMIDIAIHWYYSQYVFHSIGILLGMI